MQRSGIEAIKTQIQPSKPKRETTKFTNSQNTKRTYGQPSEQLFHKRWSLSNPNRTKNNMNTRKVKRHKNSDTKNRQRKTTTKFPSPLGALHINFYFNNNTLDEEYRLSYKYKYYDNYANQSTHLLLYILGYGFA